MKYILLAMVSLLPSLTFAEIAEPKAVVEQIFASASDNKLPTDSAQQSKVTTNVDFDALARNALGAQAKKVSATEFTWFRDTLQKIISLTVFPKAPEFLQGVQISYQNVEVKGDKAKVKSTVQNKADLTDVNYDLAKQKDGSWKVVDVTISEQSWVKSINEQVNDVIKKKQWKGLKESMSRRLKDLQKGKA